jgi:hypothetical protein
MVLKVPQKINLDPRTLHQVSKPWCHPKNQTRVGRKFIK